ncbi:MAG TPA: hypothetical protein VGE76_01140 [Opitutaceae bacterium]
MADRYICLVEKCRGSSPSRAASKPGNCHYCKLPLALLAQDLLPSKRLPLLGACALLLLIGVLFARSLLTSVPTRVQEAYFQWTDTRARDEYHKLEQSLRGQISAHLTQALLVADTTINRDSIRRALERAQRAAPSSSISYYQDRMDALDREITQNVINYDAAMGAAVHLSAQLKSAAVTAGLPPPDILNDMLNDLEAATPKSGQTTRTLSIHLLRLHAAQSRNSTLAPSMLHPTLANAPEVLLKAAGKSP